MLALWLWSAQRVPLGTLEMLPRLDFEAERTGYGTGGGAATAQILYLALDMISWVTWEASLRKA